MAWKCFLLPFYLGEKQVQDIKTFSILPDIFLVDFGLWTSGALQDLNWKQLQQSEEKLLLKRYQGTNL